MFVVTLSQPVVTSCHKSLLSLSSWCHFFLETPQIKSQLLLLLLSIVVYAHKHLRIGSHSLFIVPLRFLPSEPSSAALLPLFVKTDIMREQRVSSYYTALCLSEHTQAAP